MLVLSKRTVRLNGRINNLGHTQAPHPLQAHGTCRIHYARPGRHSALETARQPLVTPRPVGTHITCNLPALHVQGEMIFQFIAGKPIGGWPFLPIDVGEAVRWISLATCPSSTLGVPVCQISYGHNNSCGISNASQTSLGRFIAAKSPVVGGEVVYVRSALELLVIA